LTAAPSNPGNIRNDEWDEEEYNSENIGTIMPLSDKPNKSVKPMAKIGFECPTSRLGTTRGRTKKPSSKRSTKGRNG
jgi:hypothetical protein